MTIRASRMIRPPSALQLLLWAVLGVLVLRGFESQAFATPVTQNGVYEERAYAGCTKVKTCTVYFSTLKAPVRINTVSCNFYLNSSKVAHAPEKISLGTGDQAHTAFSEWQYLAPFAPMMSTDTISQYQLLANTDHALGTGQVPAVNVTSATKVGFGLYCSIAGSM